MASDPAASNDAPPGLAVAAEAFRAAVPAAEASHAGPERHVDAGLARRTPSIAVGRSAYALVSRAGRSGRQAWTQHR
jgi:hypothetical protein